MTDKNAITLADIAAILWPEGAHDEDWSADTLADIAAVMERAGHGPEGDGDEGDYGEARILAGMEGGSRGLAEFDGLETDPGDDRW